MGRSMGVGFNPCCLGLAVLALRPVVPLDSEAYRFQSLLSWISRFGPKRGEVGAASP